MARLEDGHYATRLPMPKVKELAVITERFNTLAEALDIAREENSRLYRQLITVQEEERREIANELHDEAGSLPVRHHRECLLDPEPRRSIARSPHRGDHPPRRRDLSASSSG